MKKLIVKSLLFYLSVLLIICSPCLSDNHNNEIYEKTNPQVFFYSRSGNTERVADIVCKKISVKPAEIKSKVNRQEFWGIANCIIDQYSNRSDEQEIPSASIKKELSLVLLAPVWMMRLSSPARTFLKNNSESIGEVYIITTAMRQLPEKKLQDILESVKLTGVDVKQVFCIGGVAKKTDRELEEAIDSIFENITLQVR